VTPSEPSARFEFELRNVPLDRLQEYFAQAGGTLTGERSAYGDGWSLRLEPLEDVRLFTMVIPRDLLVIEGEPEAAQRVADFMRRKTMRGGG
jgi:hypothetical protein